MGILRFLRREAWAELRLQLLQAGFSVIAPWVVAILTAAAAWVPGNWVPLPVMIVCAGLMFMATTVGLYYYQQLSYQRNPEGKFRLAGYSLSKRYETRRGKKVLVGIKYGFFHQNMALFPIQFEVIPISVTLDTSFNPKPDRAQKGGLSPIGSLGQWNEAEIPVSPSMAGKKLEGPFDLQIKYGRAGDTSHVMERKSKVIIIFNKKGEPETHEFIND